MSNKNDYLLLCKTVTTIVSNLKEINNNVIDLNKNFNKGLNGNYIKKDVVTKTLSDLETVRRDLDEKILPELKKLSV